MNNSTQTQASALNINWFIFINVIIMFILSAGIYSNGPPYLGKTNKWLALIILYMIIFLMFAFVVYFITGNYNTYRNIIFLSSSPIYFVILVVGMLLLRGNRIL